MSEGEPDRPGGEEVARLVSGMAHELRNPMQAIAINLEVVRNRVRRDAPELAAELERFAAAADENVRRLSRRLDLLVSAARGGPGEEWATVDLPRLVREVAAALGFDRRPPRVVVQAATDERGVRARRGSVVLLLHPLLEVARDASPGREEVTATVRYEGEVAALEVPVGEEEAGRWSEAARAAGAETVRSRTGPAPALVLRFPRA